MTSFSGLFVNNRINKETIIVSLSGYLDTYNSIDFTRYIENKMLKNKDANELILDLSHITYVSSTGIGSFIQINKDLIDDGKTLFLYNTPHPVKSVMELLGVYKFFNNIEEIDGE